MKTLTFIPHTLSKSTHGILNRIYFFEVLFFYENSHSTSLAIDPHSHAPVTPALDQALMQHGAPARPVKEQPLLWMKNLRLHK